MALTGEFFFFFVIIFSSKGTLSNFNLSKFFFSLKTVSHFLISSLSIVYPQKYFLISLNTFNLNNWQDKKKILIKNQWQIKW